MPRPVVRPMVMTERIERVTFEALGPMSLDEIIDVRAPEEYAIDHITGALNLPVLQDEERVRVGTLHRQLGPFDARKTGAGLVSANISRHFETHFHAKEKSYRPVIYCWRGGQRSRSLATVLGEVGWRPVVLEGGYKAYRRHVIETIGTAPSFRWVVLNGLTGAGKTLVLRAIAARGGQVLDLEGLANHKGSLFGGDLENPQPSQKRFESRIRDVMVTFERERVVFVEAESPKIGHVNIPAPLWHTMRDAPVTEIDASVEARAAYLCGDYASWIGDPERILETLQRLAPFHGAARIEQWTALCREQRWRPLIESLLTEHYDKRYGAAGSGHYHAPQRTYALESHDDAVIGACAEWLLASSEDIRQ